MSSQLINVIVFALEFSSASKRISTKPPPDRPRTTRMINNSGRANQIQDEKTNITTL